MKIPRWTLRTAVVAAALLAGLGVAAPLAAQGVTTGAISGTVVNEQGQGLEGAQISVTNRATGARVNATVRADGRYYVPALDVGGPYSVTVRRIGYAPKDSNNIMVGLSQDVVVDFRMIAQATQVQGITSTAAIEDAIISPSHQGVTTTVTDSAIARLPTLSRNFTDFLKLSPQMSTKGPGNSGGGMNNRYNAIQIDGAVATDLFGLGSTGQPGGQANAKQVPLGAVKEYQVLLAPYDVRQGSFTGALVNAVTKSGTNEFHGEAFGYYRDEKMERNVPYLRNAPFNEDQSGFSLGGPIIRDRLHFFVSAEQQHQGSPASGPYFGQPGDIKPLVPISQADYQKVHDVLINQYHFPAVAMGDSGQITDHNPLQNVFARFDLSNLPMNSRLVARYNYAGGNITSFPVSSSACNRSTSAYCGFGSGYQFNDRTNSELAQLFSNFNNGSNNELLVGYTKISDIRGVPAMVPFVQVKNIANPNGGSNTTLSAGTDNSSQGNALDQDITELTDNYTIPIQTHRITIGTKNTFYKVRNLFSQNSQGFYTFGSIDSLIADLPDRVQIGKKLDNTDGSAHFRAHTYGLYLQDEWQATPRLNVTVGLRADMPGLDSHPGTNSTIQSTLHINTANVPTTQVQWGPRFGFNWDVTGDQVNQLRGGSGVFVGQPAWVWLSDAFGNSGVNGFATFTCSSPSTAPALPTDRTTIPTTCKNGSASAPVTINTVDPNLKFPSAWRSSLAYDRRLPWNVVATLEGMYTKMVDQFYYQNIGLAPSVGKDAHGRVLYGKLTGTGAQFTTLTTQYLPGLSDVINLTDETSNKDYSYNLTAQLQKRFSNSFEGSIAYTYAHSYDQYDLTSSVAYSNWQFGRAYAGPTDAQFLAPSKWDVPHRVIASGTYTFPTKTDFSLIYDGESGVPYTYVYSGDINGDGSGNNDPMYIPKDATSASEIVFAQNGTFTPAAQADSLNAFISKTPCLQSQRGTIMKRNSCRLPWTSYVDVAMRQSLPSIRGQNLILELDAFNFLNLLNKNWGKYPSGSTNDPFILSRSSFTGGNDLTAGAQPTFKYSTNFNQTNVTNASSNYRLQVQLKYTF